MNLVSPNGVSSVDWVSESLASQNQPQLKWHKADFNAPNGNEPLALDMSNMGKGQVWINGQSIGIYWMVYAKGNCNSCNYARTYRQAKCQSKKSVRVLPRHLLEPKTLSKSISSKRHIRAHKTNHTQKTLTSQSTCLTSKPFNEKTFRF
ncbi:unnamed protein product [Lathyrus sativus]|nr:unnamed protein product [Lathyrus sativus]